MAMDNKKDFDGFYILKPLWKRGFSIATSDCQRISTEPTYYSNMHFLWMAALGVADFCSWHCIPKETGMTAPLPHHCEAFRDDFAALEKGGVGSQLSRTRKDASFGFLWVPWSWAMPKEPVRLIKIAKYIRGNHEFSHWIDSVHWTWDFWDLHQPTVSLLTSTRKGVSAISIMLLQQNRGSFQPFQWQGLP